MKKIFLILSSILILSCSSTRPQSAKSYQELLKVTQNESFPKVLIYDGPQLPITYKDYLQMGFDYISVYSVKNPRQIPNQYKYILWTGIASNDGNGKWESERSPFVDDVNQYPKRWDNRLKYYRDTYNNPSDKNKFGMMVLDIEARRSNAELENNPPYRSKLSRNKAKAITDYKTEMEKLYRMPLELAKGRHNIYKNWSSYDDIPIVRTWWDIPEKSWKEWTTNPSHLNYITHKTIKGITSETDFSKQLDFYSIGTYYFYSPKHTSNNITNQYLAYMIFHIEANQAWTKKPIYLYHYFKYQGEKEYGMLVDQDVVRNSVIFSFMSGADGMILYDDIRQPNNDPKYHLLINTFTNSITQLNKYRNYFEDNNVTFYKPINPRDLFVECKPVVRGIEKNGKLLLAATNPFAANNEITKIPFQYKGKQINIQLKGKETFLKEIVIVN